MISQNLIVLIAQALQQVLDPSDVREQQAGSAGTFGTHISAAPGDAQIEALVLLHDHPVDFEERFGPLQGDLKCKFFDLPEVDPKCLVIEPPPAPASPEAITSPFSILPEQNTCSTSLACPRGAIGTVRSSGPCPLPIKINIEDSFGAAIGRLR